MRGEGERGSGGRAERGGDDASAVAVPWGEELRRVDALEEPSEGRDVVDLCVRSTHAHGKGQEQDAHCVGNQARVRARRGERGSGENIPLRGVLKTFVVRGQSE